MKPLHSTYVDKGILNISQVPDSDEPIFISVSEQLSFYVTCTSRSNFALKSVSFLTFGISTNFLIATIKAKTLNWFARNDSVVTQFELMFAMRNLEQHSEFQVTRWVEKTLST